jgi:hypothetical protein
MKPETELLQIYMTCSEDDVGQVVKVVDAVAKAYQDEVIFAAYKERLNTMDVLQSSLSKLNREIRTKLENYRSLARELGVNEGPHREFGQQLGLRRVERIEDEIMRLENDRLTASLTNEEGGDETKLKFYDQRIAQLQEKRETLLEDLELRMQNSVELEILHAEVERLQRIATQMHLKISADRIEMNAPHRIEIIQPAIATRI